MDLDAGRISRGARACRRSLREAEAEGRIAEARAFRIGVGLAHMQMGDLREAQAQLELGLGHFDESDSELMEKFGADATASIRAFLALTLWLSGDLTRARELIEEATRLADELDHAPTAATVLMYKITIETVRNDLKSVLRSF